MLAASPLLSVLQENCFTLIKVLLTVMAVGSPTVTVYTAVQLFTALVTVMVYTPCTVIEAVLVMLLTDGAGAPVGGVTT